MFWCLLSENLPFVLFRTDALVMHRSPHWWIFNVSLSNSSNKKIWYRREASITTKNQLVISVSASTDRRSHGLEHVFH